VEQTERFLICHDRLIAIRSTNRLSQCFSFIFLTWLTVHAFWLTGVAHYLFVVGCTDELVRAWVCVFSSDLCEKQESLSPNSMQSNIFWNS